MSEQERLLHGMTPETIRQHWLRGVVTCHKAHYKAAKRAQRYHYMVGTPAVVLAAVAGATIFATMEEHSSAWMRWSAGFISMVGAVFSSLVTFLRFPDEVQRHSEAATCYGRLRRKIELYCIQENPEQDADRFWEETLAEWNEIDTEAPRLPEDIFAACKPPKPEQSL